MVIFNPGADLVQLNAAVPEYRWMTTNAGATPSPRFILNGARGTPFGKPFAAAPGL